MSLLQIIDITRSLNEATPVFPGDEPFVRTFVNTGGSIVSSVTGSSHAGTHVDFPAHLFQGTAPPPLDVFCGPATVLRIGDPIPTAARLLFKGSGALTEEDGHRIHEAGVKLVGVETMSVDELASDTLPNHRLLLGAGAAIIENLDLNEVEPGEYQLIALPLKIPDADATWVRAVLISP